MYLYFQYPNKSNIEEVDTRHISHTKHCFLDISLYVKPLD